MLEGSRVSTAIGVASRPESVISRATVLIVEEGELGSGGKGVQRVASEVVLAEMTTAVDGQILGDVGISWGRMGGHLCSCFLLGRLLYGGQFLGMLLRLGLPAFGGSCLMSERVVGELVELNWSCLIWS